VVLLVLSPLKALAVIAVQQAVFSLYLGVHVHGSGVWGNRY